MHISGQDFDVMIGDRLVHFETFTASITDNRQAVQSGGVPDGYVNGDVSATGEVELDSKNFNLIIEAAKSAGSFRSLEPFDVNAIARVGQQEQKVEIFGCLFKISELLNLSPTGGEKNKHKLPFDVTSPDFIRINGVPYLSEADTRNL
jgi:hypothetical protein